VLEVLAPWLIVITLLCYSTSWGARTFGMRLCCTGTRTVRAPVIPCADEGAVVQPLLFPPCMLGYSPIRQREEYVGN